MERLPNETLDNAISVYETTMRVTGDNGEPCYLPIDEETLNFLKELKAYRDAEEQGLLLRLPYAIGTPIYKVVYSSKINDGFIYETTMSLKYYADDINAFEKGLVYSDKEEAEQKLAEIKGE